MSLAEGSEAILTEEDLQRAIQLGLWYDSDEEESGSDLEEVDSGDVNQNGYTIEEQWQLFWSAEQDEDDPTFLTTETQVPRSHEELVEELLSQLFKEDTDFGGDELSGHYSPLQDGRAQGGASADSMQTSVGATLPCAGSTHSEPSLPRPVQPTFDEQGTSVDPERPKYYYIACEMLTSERSYVQSLRLMEKVVHGAIKTAHRTNRSILPENARKDIFLNIGEIYALTFDLLQELEERLKYWDPNTVVADIIAKRAPFFKFYSMYSERFDNAQVTYSKWLKSSKQFAELIKTIESGPLCKGLPVSSYMLCPIQRIPRYKLLLEDYLKHLPKDHPDLVNTEAALAAISEAASLMNSTISDLESQALVMRIQRRFSGKENLVAPGRKYIGRGLVEFLPGSRRKQRILFLFSDILLVAASSSHGKYKIHHKLQLKNVLVQVLESSSAIKNAFCVADVGSSKPFRFCTKSQEERNRWIKKLNKAKMSNNVHFTINTKSKYAPVLNDPEAHNSIQAVLKDPSFEHSQPSWVRRSHSFYQSASLPIRLRAATGKATPTYNSASLSRDEVDHPSSLEEEEEKEEEEIVTEFMDEEEEERQKALSLKSLKPGVDNSLSSYMKQRSARGDEWRRRWFVLTSQSLVCYQHHQHDEAVGAIPLAGCTFSLPTQADQVAMCNVFKLSHAGGRTYFFQLPSAYDLERWSAVLTELLESTINSLQL